MALGRYKTKRRFESTPEPEGKIKRTQGPLRFVVQKHAASHLHYDFRLELGGVLLSWAVPKGPSLNPVEKRLAMMVEDHPFEYRTFEGSIPKGNYGAGEVIVWDEGFYGVPGTADRKETERAMRAALEKGDVKIVLFGEKLKGEFVLAKIKGKEDNAWLLIKKSDRYASQRDVREDDRSVRSGRRLPDRAASGPVRTSDSAVLSDAPKAPMPHGVKPMLASLVADPFDRKGWIFEVKWDGFRAIAEISPRRQPVVYSRNQLPFGGRFPEIVAALRKMKHEAVFDGEIVSVDQAGRSHFQYLQNYHREPQGSLRFYVFDLLYLDGRDLRTLPLLERKRILKNFLPESDVVRYSDHVAEEGIAFYEEAKRAGLEGIIAKNGESPYRDGRRSEEWLKVKIHSVQEAVIGGFTAPRGSRKKIGALVLGVYEDGELVYIGHTGGGLNEENIGILHGKLLKLARKDPPFRNVPRTNAPVTWVEPELVCQVKFQEWTGSGSMRQPIFLGLRDDKPASAVLREKPKPSLAAVAKGEKEADKGGGVMVNGRLVEVTNLDKVYWPREKYTKQDLISYYRRMAPAILPYLKGRPESLHRHPNGISGESFFQKDMDHMPPEWAKTVPIYSESNGKDINYLVCEDEATLVYMANLGCIELNPWLSRLPRLENPDFCLFDLDPEGISFAEVVRAAQEIRKLFEALEIPSHPKTSGATGLHIAVPLGGKYDYEQSKQFAEIVMRLVHEKLPKTTSVERNPKKRERRVYLDFLQNRKGQTMVAPYSVRPRPRAPVSAPLAWEEVKKGLDPAKFNIKTIFRRLEKKGDLWKPVLGAGVDLKKILGRLEKES